MIAPLRPLLCLLLLAAAAVGANPLLAQQNVRDYQLPPASAQTGAPVQGPVDPDAPVITAPRELKLNTPAPTPTPQASPTTGPTAQAPQMPTVTAAARPQVDAISTSDLRQQNRLPNEPPALPLSALDETKGGPSEERTTSPTLPIPGPPAATSPQAPVADASPLDNTIADWIWTAMAGAILLLGLVFWWVLRRRGAQPPEIERPVVGNGKPPVDAIGPDPLVIKAEAVKLSRSLMNATLHYRLSITNRSSSSLVGLAIGGDLVAAHNQKPVNQQIAIPEHVLSLRHEIARISSGQTINFDGSLQLPLSQVNPIRQGNSPLLVPLMRWRVSSETIEPVARTYVVGNRPQMSGGRLQPFRLDEQPRTYSQIGQRAID